MVQPCWVGIGWVQLKLIGVEFIILQVQGYRISWKSKYDVVFQDKLRSRQAKIEVDPEATTRFCKARTLP